MHIVIKQKHLVMHQKLIVVFVVDLLRTTCYTISTEILKRQKR